MVIPGTSGKDVLTGTVDSDIITGFAGDDAIDGRGGTDIAVYGQAAAGYTISRNLLTGDLIVTDRSGIDGTDTLRSMELLQFTDRLYVNLAGDDASLARLYSAALGRAPDAVGLAFQLDKGLHAGLTLLQIVDNFIASAEFVARYGANTSNTAFATALYTNVLGRAPDVGGLAVQVGALDHGLARDQLVLNFADSAENKAKVLADWMLG